VKSGFVFPILLCVIYRAPASVPEAGTYRRARRRRSGALGMA
jgi:hypothetical protein